MSQLDDRLPTIGSVGRRRPDADGREPDRRIPGLDGLRAIAVVAVVVFHLDSSFARGGFLGVDIFFVVSGYLITRLLCAELTATGRIRITQFYGRRVRRLLPAAAVLAAAVTVASVFVWRGELATLPGSVLSSATYSTNWWLIADHQSYFVSTGRPPLLQHLWSLAIEEQFYLIWPLVIALVAGVYGASAGGAHGWRLRRVIPLALILAAASTAAMAWIAVRDDVPYGADTSRIYFGTDTHSMGLLLGAAAGAWAVVWPRRRPVDAGPGRVEVGRVEVGRVEVGRVEVGRVAVGRELAGMVALVAVCYVLLTVDEYRPALYRGGFLLVDALVLVVLLVAVRGGLLGRLLDLAPLRWLGRRSYSIYLWHWPVAVVTRPDLDVRGPAVLIELARIGLILLLAEASFRFVEVPLRTPSATRPGAFLRPPEFGGGGRLALSGLGGVLCVLVLAMTASPLYRGYHNVLSARPAPAPLSPLSVAAPTTSAGTTTKAPPLRKDSPSGAPSTAGPSSSAAPTASAPGVTAPAITAATRPAPVPAGPIGPVSAFGDSVLLGAANALAQSVGQLSMNAVEGRQSNVVLDEVTTAQAHNSLAPIVLIATGNNGVISPDQLEGTLARLSDRTRVLLLTDRVPRDWQDPNNRTIRSIAAHHPNVVLVDWLHISAGHENWFYNDGYHVNQVGATAYAAAVVAAAAS